MLVLYETSAGFALFKLLDDGKLASPDNLYKEFESEKGANSLVKLKAFSKFASMAEALEATTQLQEGKLGSEMETFLRKQIKDSTKERLAVMDSKLGAEISKTLGLKVVSDSAIMELYRGIRSQFSNLLSGLPEKELGAMSLGLSHSLSRYKLKFSPDKIDTMIVQAVSLLDDLDKELNTYCMRIREWYGWHFPELGKAVLDNIAFTRVVHAAGMRENVGKIDLSQILPEELITEVQALANISMGTEISSQDMHSIKALAEEILSLNAYRAELFEYLKNRMNAIAPNLSAIVGEHVGARLVAHAGSLIALAKAPASTVQILGAEKALFRALKEKGNTPKYGLIYHASLVGQAAPKIKGKISRILAAKTSLAVRMDALGGGGGGGADGAAEDESQAQSVAAVGNAGRMVVEAKLKKLEDSLKNSSASKASKKGGFGASSGGGEKRKAFSGSSSTSISNNSNVPKRAKK